MEEQYFINDVYCQGGSKVMETKLADFAKGKKHYVMTRQALERFVEDLKSRQQEIKRCNPRLTEVSIGLTYPKGCCMPAGFITMGQAYVSIISIEGTERA